MQVLANTSIVLGPDGDTDVEPSAGGSPESPNPLPSAQPGALDETFMAPAAASAGGQAGLPIAIRTPIAEELNEGNAAVDREQRRNNAAMRNGDIEPIERTPGRQRLAIQDEADLDARMDQELRAVQQIFPGGGNSSGDRGRPRRQQPGPYRLPNLNLKPPLTLIAPPVPSREPPPRPAPPPRVSSLLPRPVIRSVPADEQERLRRAQDSMQNALRMRYQGYHDIPGIKAPRLSRPSVLQQIFGGLQRRPRSMSSPPAIPLPLAHRPKAAAAAAEEAPPPAPRKRGRPAAVAPRKKRKLTPKKVVQEVLAEAIKEEKKEEPTKMAKKVSFGQRMKDAKAKKQKKQAAVKKLKKERAQTKKKVAKKKRSVSSSPLKRKLVAAKKKKPASAKKRLARLLDEHSVVVPSRMRHRK